MARGAVLSELATRWKQLDEDEKKEWNDKKKELESSYDEEKPEVEEKVEEEEKPEVEEKVEEEKKPKEKKEKKQKKKKPVDDEQRKQGLCYLQHVKKIKLQKNPMCAVFFSLNLI